RDRQPDRGRNSARDQSRLGRTHHLHHHTQAVPNPLGRPHHRHAPRLHCGYWDARRPDAKVGFLSQYFYGELNAMGFSTGLASESYDRQYSNKTLLGRIWAYAKPERKRIVVILLTVLLQGGLGALPPVIVSKVLDEGV